VDHRCQERAEIAASIDGLEHDLGEAPDLGMQAAEGGVLDRGAFFGPTGGEKLCERERKQRDGMMPARQMRGEFTPADAR
jgi:hypothetical protein